MLSTYFHVSGELYAAPGLRSFRLNLTDFDFRDAGEAWPGGIHCGSLGTGSSWGGQQRVPEAAERPSFDNFFVRMLLVTEALPAFWDTCKKQVKQCHCELVAPTEQRAQKMYR